MKFIQNKIFTLIFLSLAFTACVEDLELSPQDSLTPEAFYSNPENFPAALNGIYDALQSRGLYDLMPMLDAISDNGNTNGFITDFADFGMGQITASVNNRIINYYQAPYVLIQRANALLDNIEVEGTIAEAERNVIRAEARALRALAYMRLVYLFGDVPLITNSLTREEILNLSRTPRNEVINFVISEFAGAADALDSAPFQGITGRLTKQAVLGLRARAMVFEARLGNLSWSETLSAINEVATLAENAGNQLITFGDGSNGMKNYESIFYESNEDNTEILFNVKFDALDGSDLFFEHFGVQAGTLYMTILSNFVDDYYTTDGLPITDPSSIFDAGDPYANRDPRLHATVIVPGALFSDGGDMEVLTSTSNPVALTDFFLRKQVTLEGDIALNDPGVLDAIVLRYAELLLMQAEAENEVNGPSTAAYNAINQIRSRVNMPEVATGLSQAEFREEVIHERKIELAFEELRWFDLVTLGIVEEKINGIGELNRIFIPNKLELFPIPQTEIDLNPNLTQNPGY